MLQEAGQQHSFMKLFSLHRKKVTAAPIKIKDIVTLSHFVITSGNLTVNNAVGGPYCIDRMDCLEKY